MENQNVSHGKLLVIISLALLVGGCTTYWRPGPYAQGTFEQASARCRLLSRGMHQDPEYIQSSNQALSNTAYAFSVLGSIAQDENNKRDCMEALGWEIDSAPSSPAPAPIAAPSECNRCISSGAADCHTQCIGTMSATPIPSRNVSSPAIAGQTVLNAPPASAPPVIGLPAYIPGEPSGYQSSP
jgi:hypothetical protein